MKRNVLRRVLVATAVLVLLGVGGLFLALALEDRTNADTRGVVPTVRTMVSYDGSEAEAIMGAANEAVRRFQVWIGQLEQEEAAQAPPEEPAG
jgi:hypothetical protein